MNATEQVKAVLSEASSRARRAEGKAIKSLTEAVFDDEMVFTRLMLALAELLWGALLMWPGELFSRPTYKVMSHVMPEEAWALVFLLSASMQLSIVIQQDYHCRFARYFAAWNAVLWWFVVMSMFMSVYPPPAAISGEAILAIAAFWIWLRPYKLREYILKGQRDAATKM
jgi:hypothetical protein